MRHSLLGLLTVVAIAGLLITTGCERASTLRVASINNGNTLRADIGDFYRYFDTVDSEWVTIYQIAGDSVEVVLQYVEIGAGLPTWTPYEAIINKATIKYKSADPESQYEPSVIPMTQYVMADQTNKKTTKFYMSAVTATWKQTNFGDAVTEPPDYDILDIVKATFEFSGWDSVALRDVKATGDLQIEFGNFYDDISSFGK